MDERGHERCGPQTWLIAGWAAIRAVFIVAGMSPSIALAAPDIAALRAALLETATEAQELLPA